jgi:hypothetical protein
VTHAVEQPPIGQVAGGGEPWPRPRPAAAPIPLSLDQLLHGKPQRRHVGHDDAAVHARIVAPVAPFAITQPDGEGVLREADLLAAIANACVELGEQREGLGECGLVPARPGRGQQGEAVEQLEFVRIRAVQLRHAATTPRPRLW